MILSCQALTSQDVSNTLYIKMVSIQYAKYPLVPYNIYKFGQHFVNLLPVAFVIWMPFVYNHRIVRNICIIVDKTINKEVEPPNYQFPLLSLNHSHHVSG